MLNKAIALAESGKGRRLLNSLNKRDNCLTCSEMDTVLKTYREIGLPKEVKQLKDRRGILRDDQYDALALKVKENCCFEKYSEFALSLRDLLSSGIKMNPTKMEA